MYWGRGRVGGIQKAGNWSTQIPEVSWFWRYSETVVPMYLYSTRKRGRRARLMTMSSRRKIGYCHKRAWHASPCCSLLYFAPFCPFRDFPYCIFHLHMASDFDKELRASMFFFLSYWQSPWNEWVTLTSHVCGSFMWVAAFPTGRFCR